jgi:hypothetical protein
VARQHGIELPEYDPEQGAEHYLAAVTDAVRNRPRWRVRRWVTIGIFSFSRQAMWTDLDPERWPAAVRPERYLLLQQIYGDAPVGDLNTLAPVHDIDHPEVELQAPVLVTDADASQVSAVIDAAAGNSLVIQGPPGTGKSQTITNIIANAVWQGKSILFVSEKMAALGVVKDRLDHMGLGLFCLEVHSAKASKAQVLKALKERMDAGRVRSNAEEIERARTALQEARQRLTDYAGVINAPAGDTGLTTHDILWGDASRGTLPAGVPASALDFRFPDAVSIDRFRLRELVSAGKALDDQAAAMGAFSEPARQPWRGVGNLNITRFDRTSAIEAVQEWSSALADLLQAVRAIRAATLARHLLSEVRLLSLKNARGVGKSTTADANSSEDLTDAGDKTSLTPLESWGRDDYEHAIFLAIFRKDDKQFTLVDDAYRKIAHFSEEDNAITWQAFVEWARIQFGKGGQLRKLKALADDNPESAVTLSYLGRAYAQFSQHQLAAGAFLSAMQMAVSPEDTAMERRSRSSACAGRSKTTRRPDRPCTSRSADPAPP